MAKKKKKTVAVTVERVNTIPDISNLTPKALDELIAAAHNQKYDLANVIVSEREAKVEEVKELDKVKSLKSELKELGKEFETLCKSQKFTYTIPVTFEVSILSQRGDLQDVLLAYNFADVECCDLFSTQINGLVGKGDLPKDAQKLIQDNVDNVLEDACSEALRLTPGVIKTLEVFVNKVNKFTIKAVKVHKDLNDEGFFSINDMFGD